MELTVLGASGSYPTAHSACSGYLVRQDGYTVWMDAGNGTLVSLQKHVAITEVDAILLSHAHPDHCADLYPFFFAVLFHDRPQAVPVYTPVGVRARLESLIGAESTERFRSKFAWHELEPGDEADVGPLRVTAFASEHSSINNTMRIASDGTTLCYSGDTGPNPHLARAAAGADLFLCEASWLEEHRGLMAPIHLTASEAAEAAEKAGVARLMLTHLWPTNPSDLVRQEADAYGGEIVLARDTETVTV